MVAFFYLRDHDNFFFMKEQHSRKILKNIPLKIIRHKLRTGARCVFLCTFFGC